MSETRSYYEGIGRRKEATARVRLYTEGKGEFTLNEKTLEDYFPRGVDQMAVNQPLQVTNNDNHFDVSVKVSGGGVSGQAGAVRLGIARALLKADEDYRKVLRENGLLTRDSRAKERKKPGLKRARKAPQYTKR